MPVESEELGEVADFAITFITMLDASMMEEIAARILIAALAKMIWPKLRPMLDLLESNFANFVFHVTSDMEIKMKIVGCVTTLSKLAFNKNL